jgi:hypothetical protein
MRKHFDSNKDYIVAEGLSLEEARQICSDTQSSSRTCTGGNRQYEMENGPWFDAFTKE